MERISQAESPEERQKLMEQNMKAMQSHMEMMQSRTAKMCSSMMGQKMGHGMGQSQGGPHGHSGHAEQPKMDAEACMEEMKQHMERSD